MCYPHWDFPVILSITTVTLIWTCTISSHMVFHQGTRDNVRTLVGAECVHRHVEFVWAGHASGFHCNIRFGVGSDVFADCNDLIFDGDAGLFVTIRQVIQWASLCAAVTTGDSVFYSLQFIWKDIKHKCTFFQLANTFVWCSFVLIDWKLLFEL